MLGAALILLFPDPTRRWIFLEVSSPITTIHEYFAKQVARMTYWFEISVAYRLPTAIYLDCLDFS